MTPSELYFHISRSLENGGIEDSRFEAMCITEHITGMKLQRLLLERSEIDKLKLTEADEIIRRRILGEPLQYLLGEWEFYGMPFYVGKGVLIPRADTETLVEFAIEEARKNGYYRILDLCSGTGCIACAVEAHVPDADITAVEISERAVSYLKRNIQLNKSKVKILKEDVLKSETAEKFENADMILCNPPYLTKEDMQNLQLEVQSEPESALFGGDDGLFFYRNITIKWKNVLSAGGMLVYEIGMGQESDVAEILEENGFNNITYKKDLSGITRVVSSIKG